MKNQSSIDSVFQLLQRACASTKQMQAITIEEMRDACGQIHRLTHLNEKGLLILMLAKILHEKFMAFPRQLSLFISEMFPIDKKPRVRRNKDDDEDRPIRRRRPKKNVDIDLNELSNQSITNPVNIEAPINRDIRQGLVSKEDKQKDSNANSKSDPPEGNLHEAMTQMDRQYGLNGQLSRDPDISDNSQSSSSNPSVRFGLIPDYQKKMLIVGDVSLPQANRTVRRRGNNQGGNRTTKVKNIMDKSITLDEPTITAQQRYDQLIAHNQSRRKYLEENAQHLTFIRQLDERHNKFIDLVFNHPNLNKLTMGKKKKKNNESKLYEQPQESIEVYENTDFTGGQTNSFMPASTQFQPNESAYKQHLEINIFEGEERITMKSLREKINKPRVQVFLNLLWLSQQGQIELQQKNPQRFGVIQIIKRKKQ